MYSINDIIREKIFGSSPSEFLLYFNGLTREEQEFIFKIILCDYYKIAYNYDKEGLKIFNYKMESLLDFCNESLKNFIRILNTSKIFYDLDKFSKCLLFHTMEKSGQDRNLILISKMHLLDRITYELYEDLESYKEYYEDFIQNNHNDKKGKKMLIDYFVLKTKQLKHENEIQYKKNILEFIKNFYKWKIYIIHKGYDFLSESDIKYLNIIKNKDIDEIFSYIENDSCFFTSLIEGFMYYSTSKFEEYQKKVDEYYERNSDNKIKEKFKNLGNNN